jgi:hypothetical protein
MTAIERFRKAAMAKGDGSGLPAARDHTLHAEMKSALADMRANGSDDREELRALASDASVHVRLWAAAELLSRGDESVIPVLEEIAGRGQRLLSLSAETTLTAFRAGRLKSPFGVSAA